MSRTFTQTAVPVCPPSLQALNGTSLATENPEHNVTVGVLPRPPPTVRGCLAA